MERVRLGVILFVASEANFFLMLMAAYVSFHLSLGPGPTASSSLAPFTTALFSLALFASSATVWRAGACLKRQRYRRASTWLALTIALGALFLVGQGFEYAHLLGHGVTISRNTFGTSFFTLTGFHGLHVFLGLVLLGILLGLCLGGAAGDRIRRASHSIALYWHFVDAVWLVIFAVVYVWSYLDRVGPI